MQLDRGTLVHLGNEVYYGMLKDGAKYQDAVTAALSSIRTKGVTETELDSEVVNRVIDTMEEYYDYWRVEDENLNIVEVEKPFIYTLHEDDEIRISMAGKIDLVANPKGYTNLPYDHKSFDRTFETSRLSNQFMNYCMALRSNFLIVNKIGFQKTLKPHEKFTRVPLSYDKYILDEWKNNVVQVLVNHYLTCVGEQHWPMNITSCFKFNRKCEFYEVCDSSGKEAKMFKLSANYIDVEPWDVSKVMRRSSENAIQKVAED
jgi:hypothetical protein